MNLLIINDYGIQGGGTETRIRLFVDELLKREVYKEIHILQCFNNTISGEYKKKPVFFHTTTAFHAYKETKQLIKKHNISLVQVHNLLALHPYLLFAAKHAGIPVVWWAHDYWLLCAKRSFIDPCNASKEELCDRATKKNCSRCMGLKTRMKYAFWKQIMNYTVDHAIATAKILQDIHEHNNVLRGKWSVIVPWIDPGFFMDVSKTKKKEDNKHTILFVGSLIEFKGAWVAAKAMKRICMAYPDAHLLFIGGEQEKEGRYRMNIEAIAAEDSISKNILFLGKKTKEEIHELQRNAAVYLCPTVCMESFGLNWAEAMAAGIPIVASAIGSIPEYIQHKNTGILFSPRDHEALAAAVIELFSQPKEVKRIGKSGKEYAIKNFNVGRATKELLVLYDSFSKRKSDK